MLLPLPQRSSLVISRRRKKGAETLARREGPRQTWRPTTVLTWIVSASGIVGALVALGTFGERLIRPAEPLVDALIDRRDVRGNDRFEIPITIGNLSGTSAKVDVEPPTLQGEPARTFQIRWRRGYLDQGEYKDNAVSGRIEAPGDYAILVRGSMKAGLLRGTHTFDLAVPVKVWRNGVAMRPATVLEANPGPKTCTLQTFIEAGRTYERGLTCDITVARAADLRFRLLNAAGLRKFQIRPPATTPGSEVISATLDLDAIREFTSSRFTIALVGSIPRDVRECAVATNQFQINCEEGTSP